MRLLLALGSLAIAAFSIATDAGKPAAESALCRLGVCRFDQIFSSIDAAGMNPGNVGALVNEDPASPLAWCVFGDVMAGRGQFSKATAAFDHATILGPDMPPVLMRAVNYYFTHGQAGKALPVSATILSETGAFDQSLFSYFRLAQIPTLQLLGTGVPAVSRASISWLDWVRANGSDADLRQTWGWMKRNGLLDHALAVATVWTFWYRKSYAAAHDLWLELGDAGEPGRVSELLSNNSFADAPRGGPFDWTLEAPPSVVVIRDHGLELRFSGTDNVALSEVRQGVLPRPGWYRFTADIESSGLTTDETPFFHLFDPANPAVHAESPQIKGTTPRSRITVPIAVAAGTQALVVQLERRPSARLDNKIGGTLHVYEVSLARVRGGEAERRASSQPGRFGLTHRGGLAVGAGAFETGLMACSKRP